MMSRPAGPQADEPPVWDLSDLYEGLADPGLETDLEEARALNAELASLEGAFIAARARPAKLGQLIARGVDLYQAATDRLWRVGAFASLGASVNRGAPAWARFEADIRQKITAIASTVVFFTLELNALSDADVLAALAACPDAARWSPWLRRVRLARPYQLTADLETLFVDPSSAIANWTRLYDDVLARLRVRVGGDRLTLPEALNRLSDPTPERRRAAARGLSRALAERVEPIALCLNTLAAEKAVEDRWRGFPGPVAARNVANQVDDEAVESLEAAVVGAYGRTSHRYYRLKARAMGRSRLDHWDRNAPLSADPPRTYGWGEARQLVLEGFDELSPALADQARAVLDSPWIDARPRAGKQSGAYSHSVSASHHPFVFLNFMGERRDVLTLAHEIGHAVHQRLAAGQGTLLADTPLTLAETASIFAEGLVFDRLLADASPEDRRLLLAGRIEDALNTTVRQIAFHRFERRFHERRLGGELSCDAIGRIWLEVMGESLGPAIRLNRGYDVYWSYVSHFVHSPFYVYAYAFGHLLVEALAEARIRDPAGFAPLYEGLLAGGGTRTYVEALSPFGLDPRLPGFWQGGIRRLERLVDAFEALI